ncbi:MAG: TetR family transcriptional regulator [Synergistaceae bacterium]|jgi:TetR/AcrR family acrAB operon transcriptional repressor|nr:TetR family transcriptional regulator [Synergistaceae bacterium]
MARRTKEEAMETRRRLLESALGIMSERPFSKVSMNEIAEKIGLSKGAVYWHFKSKNDLLINLVENVCCEGEEELKANYADSESWDGLRLYFREEIKRAIQSDRSKRINMLMQRKVEWPEAVREKIFSIMKERAGTQRKMVEGALENMRLEGAIRGDVQTGDLAALITAIFHGLVISQFFGIFPMDVAKQIDFIFDAFKEQLRPDRADIRKEKVR